MNKKTFNYSSAMKQPVMVRKIYKNLSLPYSVSLTDAGIFIGIFITNYILFKSVINSLNNMLAGMWILYLVVPFYVLKLEQKLQPDGKNIFLYLKDTIRYYLTIKIPKKRFINGVPIDNLGKCVFDKCDEKDISINLVNKEIEDFKDG